MNPFTLMGGFVMMAVGSAVCRVRGHRWFYFDFHCYPKVRACIRCPKVEPL